MKQEFRSHARLGARNKRMAHVASYIKKKKMITTTLMISICIFLFVSVLFGNNGLMIYFQRKASIEK